jgi:putative transposase
MRHSLTYLYVHIVWSTWRRVPLITRELQPRIYGAIQHQASKLRCEVIAIGGIEDHVHVLLRYPPTVAISDLVRHMKGASSHLVTHVLGHRNAFKWQGAYGAFSLSKRGLPYVRDYVLNQEAHHRDGTLNRALEADSM